MDTTRSGFLRPALLLAAAALAMALLGRSPRGPFEETDHQGALDMRININTATAAEMESLPGVGPVLAERIVRHRDSHGPFREGAALDAVSGIGEGLVRSLEPYIATGGGERFSGSDQ